MRKLTVFFLTGLLGLSLAGCGLAGDAPSAVANATSCAYSPAGDPARTVDPPPGTDVATRGEAAVTLLMEEGEVTITLDRSAAPCTVNSFLALAEQGYFDDTTCHRLVDTGIFVLQCGDPTATGMGGPGYVFDDELTGDETYPPGTVAMANAGPDTNGSQFFMVWAETELPASYTVFGTLDAASLEVVQYIASQGVSAEDGQTPLSPASINSVVLG